MSIIFLAYLNIWYAYYLLVLCALVWRASLLLPRIQRHRGLFLAGVVLLISGNLFWFKYVNSSGRFAGSFVLPLGVSYLSFRLIHYFVEMYRGSLPSCRFSEFLLYVLFFPTFIAGPIERFERFHRYTQNPRRVSPSWVNYGLYRIIRGIIKKVAADKLFALLLPALNSPQGYPKPVIVAVVMLVSVRIYLDFSGYTDIAVGVSRLLGYKICENFNRPYAQPNFAAFWRNCHMSFSSWLRDYVYFPLFGYRPNPLTIYCGLFLTAMVAAFWHGLQANFVLLGVFNGGGLVVYYMYRNLRNRFPSVAGFLPGGLAVRLASVFTLCYAMVASSFIVLDIRQIKALVSALTG